MDPTENPQPPGVVDDIDPLAGGDFVVTEEGVLTAEDYAARQAAGLAPEIVSEEAIAEQALKSAESEVFDAPLLTFGERALGASTFGIADLFRGSESAYEARRRVEFNPLAATAGEIAGAVAPGLLSGGTGTLGMLARATPAGRLSAAAARTISRGGLGRVVGAGAVEGAVGSMGDYISRTALSENPSFSGEALVKAAITGGALGGALGAVGAAVGKGAGKAGRALEKEPASFERTLADALGAPPAGARRSILDAGAAKPTKLKSIVRKELAENNADRARALGGQIDEVAARRPGVDLDDFLSTPEGAAFANSADGALLVTEARVAATKLQSAATDARDAFRQYADEVGLSKAKKSITRDASADTEDRLAIAVADADTLASKYDRMLDEMRARVGLPAPPRTVDPNLAKLNEDLSSSSFLSRAREGVGGLGEKAAVVGGFVELAGAAGVDIPKPSDAIPVVGGLMGAYLQYKGFKAAVRGAGILPTSKTTKAAGDVVSLRDRVTDKVRSLASGALKRVERSPSVVLAPAQVAARVVDLQSVTPDEAARQAFEDTREFGQEVAAAAAAAAGRATQYLHDAAPKDPLGVRPPTMPKWEPTVSQAALWSRRVDAVADPAMAAARVLEDALADVEVDVLRTVYPSMFAAMGADIMANAPAILEQQGIDTLRRLARTFHLPLTVDTVSPRYGTIQAPSTMTPADPLFSRPSTPGSSPSVNLESTAPKTRPAI